ncbi:esterase family protein [Verrucomicrobiaceae bacterium 5K15]|uniref:Esterase family protein n=1 Tax=Oceaniferula flava TaxID=2800421 RepID=A0AAE2SDV7_9BACT|nr:alpha/beta hydrolase-fold protein [Oceaniferula flavus]MBK1855084.1 esterase family protein [Oceaniferula flavus]MBM1136390.1 esterase family protein [Oceaniferula flavus]
MDLSSMKAALLFLLLPFTLHAAPAPYAADSQRQADVPRGKVTRHEIRSEIFPGTLRQYYVYVPAQYDASRPAAVMVFQDGHAYVSEKGDFRTPIVFDNLIAKKDMPVTIGIFVNPGLRLPEIDGKQSWGTGKKKSNRSFEYDSMSSQYAKFLEKELLPAVAKDYRLTSDPDQRAICGLSSGGICAFTVGWERPDLFRRVMSHVGSFTNIRGGHAYPSMIRKGKVRPLRVYLQDGSNDLDNQHGNWWLGNLQMHKALEFRNYPHLWVPTDGGHGGKDGGPLFPDGLRWLWKSAPTTE